MHLSFITNLELVLENIPNINCTMFFMCELSVFANDNKMMAALSTLPSPHVDHCDDHAPTDAYKTILLLVSLSMLDCQMKTTVSRILRGLLLSFPSCFFHDENPIFSFD
jgi:hypothetical protein